MYGRALRAALVLGACTALPVPAQHADTAVVQSVHDGVYSTAQARRGEALFRQVCANCHAIAQFRDSTFRRAWWGHTAHDLFEMIRTQMPQDNPGGLQRAEYAAVLAFLLELGGFPAGDAALSPDDSALRRVRIDPPARRSRP